MNKLKVIVNPRGFVMAYYFSDGAPAMDGIIVDAPLDMRDFETKFYCYKVEGGRLIKDLKEEKRLDHISKKETIWDIFNK